MNLLSGLLVSSPQILINMLSMVLFISGGEIFIILLFILIFFGADKIPEFTRMMNKGMREFKKASDDIKREFTENTSGVMSDLRSIQSDLTESLTKEITEPVQKTVSEAEKTFEEYQEQVDYYYQNPDDMDNSGNEYRNETQSSTSENTDESTSDSFDNQNDVSKMEPAVEIQNPKSKPRNTKPKTRTVNRKPGETNSSTKKPSTKLNPKPKA